MKLCIWVKYIQTKNLFSMWGQCPFTGMETVSDIVSDIDSYNGRFFVSMTSMWHAIRLLLLHVCIFNMLMTAMDKNINRALQPYNC